MSSSILNQILDNLENRIYNNVQTSYIVEILRYDFAKQTADVQLLSFGKNVIYNIPVMQFATDKGGVHIPIYPKFKALLVVFHKNTTSTLQTGELPEEQKTRTHDLRDSFVIPFFKPTQQQSIAQNNEDYFVTYNDVQITLKPNGVCNINSKNINITNSENINVTNSKDISIKALNCTTEVENLTKLKTENLDVTTAEVTKLSTKNLTAIVEKTSSLSTESLIVTTSKNTEVTTDTLKLVSNGLASITTKANLVINNTGTTELNSSSSVKIISNADVLIQGNALVKVEAALITVQGDMKVVGNAVLEGNMSITGATTLASTLNVAGQTTAAVIHATSISASSGMNVTGNITASEVNATDVKAGGTSLKLHTHTYTVEGVPIETTTGH